MKTKPEPNLPEQAIPLAAYLAEFEELMRNSRWRKNSYAEDVRQEIRCALWEARDVPATREEAHRIFTRLVYKFESRAKRQANRQGPLLHDPADFAEKIGHFDKLMEGRILRSLALFHALEKLNPNDRWLVNACKIEERSFTEVAKELGVSDHTVATRLWRAMTRLIAMFNSEVKRFDETEREEKEQSSAIVAPLGFAFTDTEQAMFTAIWRAEGRVPTFGGGPPKPPDPPPVIPEFSPVFGAPLMIAPLGAVIAGFVLAVMLVLVPMTVVVLRYFWNPPQVQFANKGLRVPAFEVENVDQVVPIYNAQAPTMPSADTVQAPASSSSTFARPSTAPSSSPPIDPEEIKRAGRRKHLFLPSRKK